MYTFVSMLHFPVIFVLFVMCNKVSSRLCLTVSAVMLFLSEHANELNSQQCC